MYIDSAQVAQEFALKLRRKARSIPGVESWIAPPSLFLPQVAEVLKSSPIKVGGQSVSAFAEGAHTGELSASMLKASGAQFVIAGHSERRAAGEDSAAVRGQVECALGAGLFAILCVGERERDHEGEHFEFIESQLTSALKSFPYSLSRLVIAYEPVWAIGKRSDEAMKPQELQEVTIFIRKILTDMLGREKAARIKILYGGSVDETNAQALLAEGGISGFLIGRASTTIDSFLQILKLCRGK
jgi:triosephosphate isomerase